MTQATQQFRPAHRAIKRYYETLGQLHAQGLKNEQHLRPAFQGLLSDVAKSRNWTFIPELGGKAQGKRINPDGTLRDNNYLPRGYWEAKDTHDKLDDEISAKLAKGYPRTNIIFEDTRHAVLIQDGQEALRASLSKPEELAELINRFAAHTEPDIEKFEHAVDEFKLRVPDLAKGLLEKIEEAHKSNKNFQAAFADFFTLCQSSLNPNISKDAVNEMLVQHLLTERLVRTIFDNQDFTQRNAIAAEVEKVIAALTSKSFNRAQFLKSLDRFYVAIEDAARSLNDFSEKQHFLNTVYERFFQGYSVKVADTHGIVYTPQAIVDFMCASVAEVLEKEFGLTLGSKGVNILDPCTGTGNFIVNLLRRIPKKDVQRVYREQLFANEIMLLPYYIAALNIEHAYYEITGEYEPFEGLCFVDTLDMAEHAQGEFGFMTQANTARVERQKATSITVIIGNPPYNVGQKEENDNNKNRKYTVIDKRVSDTYTSDSSASNKNALSDPYVKFFRWAVDRLESRDGIVCFVSNNGFLAGQAFGGFRKHIYDDFTSIYHFDFKGNARTTGESRRRQGGNIFNDQIRCGVGITLLIRLKKAEKQPIFHHCVDDYWKSPKKELYLRTFSSYTSVPWKRIIPEDSREWLTIDGSETFENFVPIGDKKLKALSDLNVPSIFKVYSGGVKSNRDEIVYSYWVSELKDRVLRVIDAYNAEIDRWKRLETPVNVDDFVRYSEISWSRDLKQDLIRGIYAHFGDSKIRKALFRPYSKKFLFLDRVLNEEVYAIPRILPCAEHESENKLICVTTELQIDFSAIISNVIPCLHVGGRQGQCFPFYIYDEDGSNRRENITDWALNQFQAKYRDTKITKWDIFHYVYGILHHHGYREKYGENLKRKLPRIPYAPDFWHFSKAGKELATWHLDYESIEPHPLRFVETPQLPLSYRVVDKMRLSKDKTELKVNPSLTLAGIPAECFQYRLGNRSALDWVIDQYRIKKDDRSGITSNPNREDDPEYIVRLVGQVIRVSLETVRIVGALPGEFEV